MSSSFLKKSSIRLCCENTGGHIWSLFLKCEYCDEGMILCSNCKGTGCNSFSCINGRERCLYINCRGGYNPIRLKCIKCLTIINVY